MERLRKVCLMTNYNLYESKRYFTEKLAEALERKGVETKVIDVQQAVIDSEMTSMIRRFSPDFTCSFNSFEPVDEGRYMWDFLKIPHVSFLVDPCFYSTALIKSPYSILSCVDRSDCAAILSNDFDKVFFWPHAVERELGAKKEKERVYEVVFLGSCYDYENLRVAWQQRYPPSFNQVLDDAIDLVWTNEKISLAEALVAAWKVSKLDLEGVDFATLYYYLDTYTRGRDRIEVIRSIKNADVHIFGELSTDDGLGIWGWSDYLSSQKNVTIHPSTPFGEGMKVLKQAKIVLNSMPFFRDGTHERIFTALACGAVPITSESLYLREEFIDGKELLFYSSKDRDMVSTKIDQLLANESERKVIAAKGREVVMKRHTWDQRVEQLMEALPLLLSRLG